MIYIQSWKAKLSMNASNSVELTQSGRGTMIIGFRCMEKDDDELIELYTETVLQKHVYYVRTEADEKKSIGLL